MALVFSETDRGSIGGASCTARQGGSIVGCVLDGGSEQLAESLRGVGDKSDKLMQLRWEKATGKGGGSAVVDLERGELLGGISNPFKRRANCFVP